MYINGELYPLVIQTGELALSSIDFTEYKSGLGDYEFVVEFFVAGDATYLLSNANQTSAITISVLATVQGLRYEKSDSTLVWTAVSDADGYALTFYDQTNTELKTIATTTNRYVLEDRNATYYRIEILATTTNPNMYETATTSVIDVLVNVEVTFANKTMTWASLPGLRYEVKYGLNLSESSGELNTNSYALTVSNFAVGTNRVQLVVKREGQAIGNGQPEIVTFTKLASVTELGYNEGVFTWASVTGAIGYDVFIDGTFIEKVSTPTYQLPSEYEGLVTIEVVAYGVAATTMESNQATGRIVDRLTITYEEETLSWEQPEGLSARVYINGELYQELGININSINLRNDSLVTSGSLDIYILFYQEGVNLLYARTSTINIQKLEDFSINNVVVDHEFITLINIDNELIYSIYFDDTFYGNFDGEPIVKSELDLFGITEVMIVVKPISDFILESNPTIFNIVVNFSITYDDGYFSWEEVPNATSYSIYFNDQLLETTSNLFIDLAQYELVANDFEVTVVVNQLNVNFIHSSSNTISLTIIDKVANLVYLNNKIQWTQNNQSTNGYQVQLFKGIAETNPISILINSGLELDITSYLQDYYLIDVKALSNNEYVFYTDLSSIRILHKFSFQRDDYGSLNWSDFNGIKMKLTVIGPLYFNVFYPNSNPFDTGSLTGLLANNQYTFSIEGEFISPTSRFIDYKSPSNTIQLQKLSPYQAFTFANNSFVWTFPQNSSSISAPFSTRFSINGSVYNLQDNQGSIAWNTIKNDYLLSGSNTISAQVTKFGAFIPSNSSQFTQSLSVLASPDIEVYLEPGTTIIYRLRASHVPNATNYLIKANFYTNASNEAPVSATQTVNLALGSEFGFSSVSGLVNYKKIRFNITSTNTSDSGKQIYVDSLEKTIDYYFDNHESFMARTIYSITETNNASMDNLKKLYLGYVSSAVLSQFGNIYTWGKDNAGQLGNATLNNIFVPKNISAISNIYTILGRTNGDYVTKLALGENHSGAITAKGLLFTWGSSSNGILGNGTTSGNLSTANRINNFLIHSPTLLDPNKFESVSNLVVTDIAFGKQHSSIVAIHPNTGNKILLTFGNNGSGRLGLGNDSNQTIPKQVIFSDNSAFGIDETITQVELGLDFSALLTSKGRIFTWGNNSTKQLGHSEGTNTVNKPVVVPNNNPLLVAGDSIKMISAGNSHLLAVTNNGYLYSLGDNTNGKLGVANPSTTPSSNSFLMVNGFGQLPFYSSMNASSKIVKAQAGGNYSFAIAEDGTIYTWGNDFYGQLGNGGSASPDQQLPIIINKFFNTSNTEITLLPNETIIDIVGGEFHLGVVTSLGRIFIWGDVRDGKSGHYPNYNLLFNSYIFQPTMIDTCYLNPLDIAETAPAKINGCNP